MQNRALFLDRDGVINVDHGYVFRIDEFEFLPKIFDVVRVAVAHNYKILIVTNQAGIGRGYYSESQFLELTDWMLKQFAQESAPVDKVYFSPFHPTAGLGKYLKDDFSRKPHPGMFLQAQQEFELDLEQSILVGDKLSDMQAGISAGVGTNVLFCPNSAQRVDASIADLVIVDLSEVFSLLVECKAT